MVYWFVGFGGIIGSLLRYGLSLLMNPMTAGSFPLGTLFVNLTGTFLLGFCTVIFSSIIKWPDSIKRGITVGIIGSFTTFSTFSIEMVDYILNKNYAFALMYFSFSTIGGWYLLKVGILVGTRMIQRVAEEESFD